MPSKPDIRITKITLALYFRIATKTINANATENQSTAFDNPFTQNTW